MYKREYLIISTCTISNVGGVFVTKVLIIEDEVEIVSFLNPELSYEGYEVDSVGDGREGFEKIQNEKFDIVLLDIMLPGLK